MKIEQDTGEHTLLAHDGDVEPMTVSEESQAPRIVSAPPKKLRKRTVPPTPSLEAIYKARFLPIRYAAIRYPGITEAAFRHMVWKSEYDRRNPGESGKPSGFAKCIVRPGGRQVLIDCFAYDELLLGQPIGEGKARSA